jgi:hypothetical protein
VDRGLEQSTSNWGSTLLFITITDEAHNLLLLNSISVCRVGARV